MWDTMLNKQIFNELSLEWINMIVTVKVTAASTINHRFSENMSGVID